MSFRDLIESSQATALANKLNPNEYEIWLRFCREYSKRFNTPLKQVMQEDPEWVITQIYSDNFSDWNVEEKLYDILDIIGSLSDPEYDVKVERAKREELEKIIQEERDRLARGESIHTSLNKNKKKKELPKSGGINLDLIKQLEKDEKEAGEF